MENPANKVENLNPRFSITVWCILLKNVLTKLYSSEVPFPDRHLATFFVLYAGSLKNKKAQISNIPCIINSEVFIRYGFYAYA